MSGEPGIGRIRGGTLRLLGNAARQALADPMVRQRLVENGLIPTYVDASTFGARITTDREHWREVIRVANIQAN